MTISPVPLCEIDPVSAAVVDPQFRNARLEVPVIAGIPHGKAVKTNADAGHSLAIPTPASQRS